VEGAEDEFLAAAPQLDAASHLPPAQHVNERKPRGAVQQPSKG
jgi:hypothetical protein